MKLRKGRVYLAAVLVLCLIAGIAVIARDGGVTGRTNLVAYFDNSDGIFVGDEVRIVGVAVGLIDKIEAEPLRVKISFWVDDQYKVPADAGVHHRPGHVRRHRHTAESHCRAGRIR